MGSFWSGARRAEHSRGRRCWPWVHSHKRAPFQGEMYRQGARCPLNGVCSLRCGSWHPLWLLPPLPSDCDFHFCMKTAKKNASLLPQRCVCVWLGKTLPRERLDKMGAGGGIHLGCPSRDQKPHLSLTSETWSLAQLKGCKRCGSRWGLEMRQQRDKGGGGLSHGTDETKRPGLTGARMGLTVCASERSQVSALGMFRDLEPGFEPWALRSLSPDVPQRNQLRIGSLVPWLAPSHTHQFRAPPLPWTLSLHPSSRLERGAEYSVSGETIKSKEELG